MKTSNYNFFYETSNKETGDIEYIAYNSRTNALAIMTLDEFNTFNNNIICDFSTLNLDLRDNLIKGGFILDDEVNELELIKLANLTTRFSSKSLTLTIAPTLECNFNCVYCFENSQNNTLKMSKETQNKLIDYIKQQASTLQHLHIDWYGGEPLLAFDIIEYLTENILEICKQNNIHYSAAIVTNGYKLTPEIGAKFKQLFIEFVQITLDGPPKIHNIRRPLKGGQPTFDKIIDNISNLKDDTYKISLRINVDKNNCNDLDEVLQILEEKDLFKKVSAYLGHVLPAHDCYENSTCLSPSEFKLLTLNFLHKLKKITNQKVFLHAYPKLCSASCSANVSNSLVIDSEGNFYKCWNDIGRADFSFGDLNSGVKNFTLFNSYVLYDCTSDEKCCSCKILPMCMGGCAQQRLSKERCDPSGLTAEFLKCFIEEKIS